MAIRAFGIAALVTVALHLMILYAPPAQTLFRTARCERVDCGACHRVRGDILDRGGEMEARDGPAPRGVASDTSAHLARLEAYGLVSKERWGRFVPEAGTAISLPAADQPMSQGEVEFLDAVR
jgi:hypothetical protein